MRQSSLTPSSVQSHQTRHQFVTSENYLSYELGQTVKQLPPLYARLLTGGISLLVFGTLTWAHFSQVDEVVSASGKLVPSAQMRPVRSLGEGTIQVVHVKTGDRVKKGEILLERDPALTQVEIDRLQKSAQPIREDLARLDAERTGQSFTGIALQDQLLDARLQEFDSRRETALAETNRQDAALDEARIKLTRLYENLANARENLIRNQEIEKRIKKLAQEGGIARLSYINTQKETTTQRDMVVSLEKDIAAQQQAIRQAQGVHKAALQSAERLAAERQSEILARLHQRHEELVTIKGQIAAAKKQLEQETIKAPIAGTIYNIKATTGPVQAGEELLSILPANVEVELEANVLNRDIGFITRGMQVKVKIATFPFQEFGTIDGYVSDISADAVIDEKVGLVFPVKVKLTRHSIGVRGEDINLAPGMAATGEIVTRQKSILSFLIEPVMRRVSEAFSVR